MQRQDFERVIRAALVKHAATTGPDRERLYEAARASFMRRQGHSQGDLAVLEAAIQAVEATFVSKPATPTHGERLKSLWLPAAALLVGIFIGAGSVFSVQSGTPLSSSALDQQAIELLGQAYSTDVVHMPEATKFIRQVVDAVVARQGKDKASLEESAKTFIPLEKFDPELASRMPKTLPPGTGVIVRANASNLKVMMNWTLCGVASITNPEMVDRKRNPEPSIGCPFFGLWTDGAADW